MKIVEAKSWLDGHPQFQTESQWAYVIRMLTGYGAAIERAAETAAIERCAKVCDDELYAERAAAAIRALLPKEE